MTDFVYSSPVQEFIQGMIRQKRSLGYKYDSSERTLYKFDQFCLVYGCTEPVLSKELVHVWSQKGPNEAQATLRNRVVVVRQLAMYMTGLGAHAYVFPRIRFQRPPSSMSCLCGAGSFVFRSQCLFLSFSEWTSAYHRKSILP